MATTIQVVAAINSTFGIQNAELWATRLRMAGRIQSTQGVPAELPPHDIVKFILAVLIGFPAARKTELVETYGALRPEGGGDSFAETLERFLAAPEDVYAVAISHAETAAAMSFRAADRSTQTVTFRAAGVGRPPGLSRTSSIDADAWQRLVHLIRNPSPSRRPRRRRKSTTH